MAVVLQLLASVVAFLFIYKFAVEMSLFEFQPDQRIMDQFIQMHSVLITGINKQLPQDAAERGIKKVFDFRFGPENIVKV